MRCICWNAVRSIWPDPDILSLAAEEDRVLLTCDLDFGDLISASQGSAASVVMFRGAQFEPDAMLARLRHVLPGIEADLSAGAIVIIELSRHRVRRLPVDG